jgi:polynucleotide 5'-kinase involved in rRNA processing
MANIQAHQVITANRLSDGAVVYFVAPGEWTDAIAAARVAEGEEAAAALLAQAETREEQLHVVGPYLMAASIDQGIPQPKELREVIRAKGPTIHPNLGKQAEAAAQGATAAAG